MHDSIPAPIPLRPRSAPVPVARTHAATGPIPVAVAHVGSSALQIAPRPRALIVDDCRFIAERVARTLEGKGFECTIAPDGLRGLELLGNEHFDFIVLDIDLPKIDGFSLLRAVRRDSTHVGTPVLMLSAEPSASDHERSVSLGANGMLTKPLQLRPLTKMLDSLIDA